MHYIDILAIYCNITFFLFFLQFSLYDIRTVDLTRRCELLVFAFYYVNTPT